MTKKERRMLKQILSNHERYTAEKSGKADYLYWRGESGSLVDRLYVCDLLRTDAVYRAKDVPVGKPSDIPSRDSPRNDQRPIYQQTCHLFPLSKTGYDEVTRHPWDRFVDAPIFRMVRDLAAFVALVVSIYAAFRG